MELDFNSLDVTPYCSNVMDGGAIDLIYHGSNSMCGSFPLPREGDYPNTTIDMNHDDLNFLNFQDDIPGQLLPPVNITYPAQPIDSHRMFTLDFSPTPSSLDFSEGVPSPFAFLPSSLNSPLHDEQVWQGSPLKHSIDSPHVALPRKFGLSDSGESSSHNVGRSRSWSHSDITLGVSSKEYYKCLKRSSLSYGDVRTDGSPFPTLELPSEVLGSTLFNGENREPSVLSQLLPSTVLSNSPTVSEVPAGDNLLSLSGELVPQQNTPNVSDICFSEPSSRELPLPCDLHPSPGSAVHRYPDGNTGNNTIEGYDPPPGSRSRPRTMVRTKSRREIYSATESILSPPGLTKMSPQHSLVTNLKSEMAAREPTLAKIHQPTPTIPFRISLTEEADDSASLPPTAGPSAVLSNGVWNSPGKLGSPTNSENILAGHHISSLRNSLQLHLAGDLGHISPYVSSTLLSPPSKSKATRKVASQKLEANALKKRVREPRHRCTRPGCGQTFTEKHNFNNHMNSHDGLKPHPCKHCHKTFAARSTLSRHSKTCASNTASVT